jgi:hypothetical protein
MKIINIYEHTNDFSRPHEYVLVTKGGFRYRKDSINHYPFGCSHFDSPSFAFYALEGIIIFRKEMGNFKPSEDKLKELQEACGV